MKKVFVGLSGGVDSAVSAALLKEQGHDVTGVFIKIWQPEFIECTWKEDRLDAMRVCASLDIPFRELDLSDEYQKEVVDEMLRQYERGVTPNPDVLCNRSIKFGAFAKWAKAEGADALATGHYARIEKIDGRHALLRARDSAKDQSYFLYTLRESDLARTYFPIGNLLKSEVRTEAKRFDLPVARKPDSQGLCFVGEVSMRDFLSRFLPVTSGPVVTSEGSVVGEHEGAMLYTIGQRHGFTTRGIETPLYVTNIDIAKNSVVVSAERTDAARSVAELDQISWVSAPAKDGEPLAAQARYHETPVRVSLKKTGERYTASFDTPHIVAPGQALVLYRGEACLGGGTLVPTVHR